jgi:prophage regulatory protein
MSNNTERGANMSPKILRLPAVKSRSGDSRSTTYLRITQGLWTTPVHLGPRAVGWPDYECDALIAARIAGKTEDEIRTLVTKLEAERKFCTGGSNVADLNPTPSFHATGGN